MNCIELNKQGASVRIDHHPNDDRCHARINRINGLKQFYIEKAKSKQEQGKPTKA